jgi:hypothetical protein
MSFQILSGRLSLQSSSRPGKEAKNVDNSWNFIVEDTVQWLTAVK